MDVNDSLLDLIGNTPMMKLKSLDTGLCDLYVKLELNNPGGSIPSIFKHIQIFKRKR